MSSNRHKTVMCRVCGEVMRDDTLTRHMSTKHGNVENDVQHDVGHHQPQRQAAFESDAPAEDVHQDRSFASNATEACNQHNDAFAETDVCDGEPMKTPNNAIASLEYELVRNNETYKKNIEIGEQISDVLRNGKIVEKSLTKQHQFRATLVARAASRLH